MPSSRSSGVGRLVNFWGAHRTLGIAALFAAPITGYAIVRWTELATVALVAGFLILLALWLPSYALALWLALTVLVPDWVSVPVPLSSLAVHPLTAAGVPVLAGLIAQGLLSSLHWTWVDTAVGFAGGSVLSFVLFFDYATFTLVNVALVLILSYALGRLTGPDAGTVFAVVMTVVAIWGIAEFVTGIHVFENLGVATPVQHWNQIQVRAGLDRSETSFGHAIAYGASLAMAIPFTYRLHRGTFPAQLILVAGVAVSLSRGPMLALLLTLLLCTVILASGRLRIASLLVLAVASAVVCFILGSLYTGESASEVDSSTDARAAQFAETMGSIVPFGSEPGSAVTNAGRLAGTSVTVIDSTPLRLAVNYGWVIALGFLSPVFLAVVGVLRRKKSAAAIALVGQIPVLLLTSLITQWQALIFFVAGMAVTELSRPVSTGARNAPRMEPAPLEGWSPGRPA